jgi:16S rRNA processing protein RimM
VHGDVRVTPYTDLPERFSWLKTVYVGEEKPRAVAVEKSRKHKDWILVKLAGYDSREEVAVLRGELLLVPEEEAIPLEEDEYFLFQLIGLTVETVDGVELGTLVEIIETGANNVFVVRGATEEHLLPDIPEVIVSIDFDEQRMIVDPLPGMLNA